MYLNLGGMFVNSYSKMFMVNMKEEYKEIFGVDYSFDEFVSELKNDIFIRKVVVDILYMYYGFKKMPIVTDSNYEKWYFVNYGGKEYENNNYIVIDNCTNLFTSKAEYKIA